MNWRRPMTKAGLPSLDISRSCCVAHRLPKLSPKVRHGVRGVGRRRPGLAVAARIASMCSSQRGVWSSRSVGSKVAVPLAETRSRGPWPTTDTPEAPPDGSGSQQSMAHSKTWLTAAGGSHRLRKCEEAEQAVVERQKVVHHCDLPFDNGEHLDRSAAIDPGFVLRIGGECGTAVCISPH